MITSNCIANKLVTEEIKNRCFWMGTNYGRLTYRNVITLSAKNLVEVKIYTEPSFDEKKKIDGSAIGRYILFSEKMYWESQGGIAACKVIKWGAYSLLPEKYNKFLPGLT